MAINGCSTGVMVTALVALLVLPAQYYVPELGVLDVTPEPPPPSSLAVFDRMITEFPPFDLFITAMLLLLGFITYTGEWIQRKILEIRTVKLNQYLKSSLERLRSWDAQQEQLETTLKLVQNATSEYNLLLYLLLRQHRCITSNCPPSNCFFEKGLEEVTFLNPTVESISKENAPESLKHGI